MRGCCQPHGQWGPVGREPTPGVILGGGAAGAIWMPVSPCHWLELTQLGGRGRVTGQGLALAQLLPGMCGLDSPSDLGLCVSISAELTMTPVPRRTPCPDGNTGSGRGCSGTELNKSLHLRGLAGKGGPGLEPTHISHSPRGSRETEAQRPTFLKVLPVAWVGLGLDQR